jgi:uncharacterized protein YjdB
MSNNSLPIESSNKSIALRLQKNITVTAISLLSTSTADGLIA